MAKVKITIDMPLDVEDGEIQYAYGIPFVATVKKDKDNKLTDYSFQGEFEEKEIESLIEAKKIKKVK